MTGLLDRVVDRLAAERGARLVWRNDRAAGLAIGTAAVLVFAAEGEDLPELLPATVDASRATEIDLILVGGGARARAALQGADLGRRMERFGVRCHVAEDGDVWTEGGWLGRPGLRRLLQEAVRGDRPSADPAVASLSRAAAGLEAHDLAAYLARPTRVTRGLMSLFLLLFAVEALFGGSTWTPVLVRLGATVPGEPWRALSASTLHIGLPHLLFNLYALHVLGGTVERALGPARFLVLWVGSCLLGGVLGGLTAVSAGASTGLWGLMFAQAVLLYRKSPLYPAIVVRVGRRGVWTTVAINLAISFLPGISLWGHLGGGIAGAVLAAGLLERPWRWRPAAYVAGVLLLTSVILAFVLGRPWELAAPTWRTDAVSGVPVELPIRLTGGRADPIEVRIGAPGAPCEACLEGPYRVWRGPGRGGVVEVRVEAAAPEIWLAAGARVWRGLQE